MAVKAYQVVCLLLLILQGVVGPPVDKRKKEDPGKGDGNKVDAPIDYGLEYSRYLQEVVQTLEQDREFSEKLKNVNLDDIRSGNVAHELQFVNHDVRNQLDELKRIEMDRLRKLTVQAMEKQELGLDRGSVKMPHHVDVKNPHSFEIEDLKKLIVTATKDLEKLDEQRKKDFKEYEIRKELEYRKSLENMTAEERLKAEQHHNETIKKHQQHEPVHEPGSKPQLQEVWEEQDHMEPEEFNPNTFFAMHDLNGDGYLDPDEIAAVLNLEVKKMYKPGDNDTDLMERNEEVERMREHVLKEGDKDKDGLISNQEFLDMTHRRDFEKDEGWKGLNEQQVYSEEDLQQYQQQHPDLQLQHPYQQQYPGGPPYQGHPQYQGHPPPQYQGHPPPHGAQYQGVPNQMGHQGVVPPPQPGQYHAPQGQQYQQPPPHHGQFQQPPHPNQFQQQPHHPAATGQQFQQQPHHPAGGQQFQQPGHIDPQLAAQHHAASQQYAAHQAAQQQHYAQQQQLQHHLDQQHLAQQQHVGQQQAAHQVVQQAAHAVQQQVPLQQQVPAAAAPGHPVPVAPQQIPHSQVPPAAAAPAATLAAPGIPVPQQHVQDAGQHQQPQHVPVAAAAAPAAPQAVAGGQQAVPVAAVHH